jgi:aromatic ring-opening dioxygenase catalytic subunit (LigB family)
MLEAIFASLKQAGVNYKTEKRGLDHGVWGEQQA